MFAGYLEDYHIFKRLKVNQKHSTLHHIFSSPRGVWKYGKTQSFVFGIHCVTYHRNGPIYTGDGSYVWDELGQRTVARLIIRLCINTGKQTDHPS